MSNEDLQIEKPDAQRALAHVHFIYLVTTALATIGWFWLIGWCALQLV